MQNKKIAILGTGGTIAGTSQTAADNVAYTAARLGVDEVLGAIPSAFFSVEVITEQIAQVDSKDMGFAVWTALAERVNYFLEREDIDAIVITHGTDTLEETAYFLHAVFQPCKAVVLTCAMRPATALCPDGPQNLLDALTVAQFPGARGVVAVCAGTIHGAAAVQKVHPYRLDAFSSGDSGAIGFVEGGKLRIMRDWPPAISVAASNAIEKIAFWSKSESWPRVEIVMSHVGADGSIVDSLVASGVEGLVIACTGNGTLHCSLEAAIVRAEHSGVRVVLASRCWDGRIVGRSSGLSHGIEGLSPVKARIELLLELILAQ